MFEFIRRWNRSASTEPYVRPWGLATPVLVLVVCLPLLRPLLHPTDMSENERQRLATVQAIVEHRTLGIGESSFYPPPPKHAGRAGAERVRATQPPVLAAMLAGPYWVMHHFRLTFDSNLALASYLLTMLGVTLPVAGAAAVVYRMGRLFELDRPWRMLLAFASVFGSGLISYATVLNSHAPAAALVLCAAGALFHGAMTRRQNQATAWLCFAGFLAALGAVIDLGAMVFLVLLAVVIFTLRWSKRGKLMGLACYIIGAVPPIVLYVALAAPVELETRPVATAAVALADDDEPDSGTGEALGNLASGLIGSRGVVSHFPALVFGIVGVGIVLHRNWPGATKMLGAGSLAAGGVIVVMYVASDADWGQAMFTVRWYIVFVPMVMMWSGAWLRRGHRPVVWGVAGAALGFSVMTGLLGAAMPFTEARPGEYSAYAAARQVFRPAKPATRPTTRAVG